LGETRVLKLPRFLLRGLRHRVQWHLRDIRAVCRV